MTPLAHRIVKDASLAAGKRKFRDQGAVLGRMNDIHCFDATEVFGMAADLAMDLATRAQHSGILSLLETQTFLPAQKTWIEWKQNGDPVAVLLEQMPDGRGARAYWSVGGAIFASAERHGGLLLMAGERSIDQQWPAVRDLPGESDNDRRGMMFFVYAVLAIINTPRLIGRKQHMPHRGLERQLLKAGRKAGMFSLRAWTELTLSVSAMMTEADGTVHEAHYTGEKCLHFCRAHLRVRNGRLEQVKAHWRGNPALGVKQTRYRLAA